jgi:hypothetical protein
MHPELIALALALDRILAVFTQYVLFAGSTWLAFHRGGGG